ncbi:MAG: hypothetical protein R2744_11060 [Bacteroidales bacterium]
MMINFFISSVMTLAVGALSDRYGMERVFAISAVLSSGAIFFALRVPKTERV